ncbi:WD40 repeat domain-containing protein [Streptomyces sp. NPDC046805]|uniref:WD40 repeat domain-containing protein n=1 Tax=Streptomyces sp. NPDC046805 TaxID=3155134 RepID=UPI0034075B11
MSLEFDVPRGDLIVHDGVLAPLPDGRVVLATSDPDGLRTWDVRTGQLEDRISDTTMWQVAATTSKDGRAVLAGAGIDGHLHRWDAATGEPVGAPWKCHDGYVMTVTDLTLPDGTPLLVTGGEDGTVRRWHAGSGAPVGKPLPVSPGSRVCVVAACVLEDGRGLLVAHDDEGALFRWDAATGEPVGPSLPTGDWWPNTIAVVPVQGVPRVIVGCDDDTVRQRNAFTGEQLAAVYPGMGAAAVTALPDGSALLAAGSRDGALVLDRLTI